MKKIILFAVGCMVALSLSAQRTTGEQPYGLKADFLAKTKGISLAVPDRARIAKEDLENDQQPQPVRYAYPIQVSYTLDNSGTWQHMDDGSKIWRLKVSIPGALSTNTYYDKFWLPKGCKFFVYNEDTKQAIGAITSDYVEGTKENPTKFATAIIYGEDVVYEYHQPASVGETPVIAISRIDYGYRHINNPYKSMLRNFGDAGTCQVNINCSEGAHWQREKHAAARMSVVLPNGSGWCSCALINNTNNDYTPYVLTANHCLGNAFDAIGNSNASQWVFYWEYEHAGCANSSTQPTLRTTTGATVVANSSVSDFALLRLNAAQDPRNVSGVTPYYLGWDASGRVRIGGVGIHHPKGDVKKISTYSREPINSYCANSNMFWDVRFIRTTNNHSVMEPGSSGSPLITSFRRVIGQLYGPYNAVRCPAYQCDNPSLQQVAYGKFSVSWTGNGTTDKRRRLRDWLDPNNTGFLTSIGICSPVNLINQTITTNTTINGCDNAGITVQNVTVTNGAKLTFDTANEVTLTSDFEVAYGAELEIKYNH